MANGVEIEYKFLVKNDTWKKDVTETISIAQVFFEEDCNSVFRKSGESVCFEFFSDQAAVMFDAGEETKNILNCDKVKFDNIGNFYFNHKTGWTTRLRLGKNKEGEYAEFTIKGPNDGLVKPEFNFPVDPKLAQEIIEEFKYARKIEKIRHIIPVDNESKWEVDIFSAPESVKGLTLAEIEIPYLGYQFEKPGWIGEDVSSDPRYYNKNMI